MKFANLVKELTVLGSGGAGLGDIQLAGAVTGYRTFGSAVSNGDKVAYMIHDTTQFEIGTAVFHTSPDRLTSRVPVDSSSSGSLINWPSTGQREVVCVLPAEWLALFNIDSQGVGVLVRTGAYAYVAAALQDGAYLAWTDPTTGIIGFDDTVLDGEFAHKEHLTADEINALWTFKQLLVFNGFTTSGPPDYQYIKGKSSEDMFRWRRDGAGDYEIEVREGNASWRRLIKATSGDLNDADRLSGDVKNNPGGTAPYNNTSIRGPNYVSGDQTITAGSLLTLTHGLGGVPSRIVFQLVCITDELTKGYTAGDVLFLAGGTDVGGDTNHGIAVKINSTQILVQLGNTAGGAVFSVPRFTGASSGTVGNAVDLVNANWNLRVLAWI